MCFVKETLSFEVAGSSAFFFFSNMVYERIKKKPVCMFPILTQSRIIYNTNK